MTEYIKREAVMRHKRKMGGEDFGGEFWDYAVLCEDIRKIPTADVVEVVHGEWQQNKYHKSIYYCSKCGRHIEDGSQNPYKHFPYCHCGAKMDGKGDA